MSNYCPHGNYREACTKDMKGAGLRGDNCRTDYEWNRQNDRALMRFVAEFEYSVAARGPKGGE